MTFTYLYIPRRNLELPRCEAMASGDMLGDIRCPQLHPASLTCTPVHILKAYR